MSDHTSSNGKPLNVEKGKQGFQETASAPPTSPANLGEPAVGDLHDLPTCPVHGGQWGDDETCENCTNDDGSLKDIPLDLADENASVLHASTALRCTDNGDCPVHGGPWGEDETCENCTDANGNAQSRWTFDDMPGGPVTDQEMADALMEVYSESFPSGTEFESVTAGWNNHERAEGDEREPRKAVEVVIHSVSGYVPDSYIDPGYYKNEYEEEENLTFAAFNDDGITGISPAQHPQAHVSIDFAKASAEGHRDFDERIHEAGHNIRHERKNEVGKSVPCDECGAEVGSACRKEWAPGKFMPTNMHASRRAAAGV